MPRPPQTAPDASGASLSFGLREWLFVAALVATVLLVYQPAWHGGFIWDDNAHVTRPELRSWHGLFRIWFDVGATQQYYPLLHSAFWVQHWLWGDAVLGYHLVNILLHAAAAVMVALILRRLCIPGAFLAAAIFALHPVQVESVAWITELKNTLSAIFYLGSVMTYLRFDKQRKASLYSCALSLFLLGLLSKTVTATLPGALLVIFWWQRGRLTWRKDVLPLLPFFLLGAAAGVFTAWVERRMIGAEGAAYEIPALERCLIAGRVIWFYLGKLLWPSNLIFIYPRWQVSGSAAWQYLFPLAALAFAAALWALRRQGRAPLAAVLFFIGTLFPVLGFFNVFPFIYSFVADHFQYLASLGIITLVSAAIAMLLERWRLWRRLAGHAICGILLATLAVLTWRQSRMYSDIETLYRTTIALNPTCWMAHNNLGLVLADKGHNEEAISHYRRALVLNPECAQTHNNLGMLLGGLGRKEEAVASYLTAIKANPLCVEAHYNLGGAMLARGRLDEAIAEFRKALEIRPDYEDAHYSLANVLAGRGKVDEAIAHYREALAFDPDYVEAHVNLGGVLAGSGHVDEAIVHFQKALQIDPDCAEAHYNLGSAMLERGQIDEAIARYQRALQLKPDYEDARYNLGIALARRKQVEKVIGH